MGWAETTWSGSGAAQAADPPSFAVCLPWHQSGSFPVGTVTVSKWNLCQPQPGDLHDFSASRSLCLQGVGGRLPCLLLPPSLSPAFPSFSPPRPFILSFDLDLLHFAFN